MNKIRFAAGGLAILAATSAAHAGFISQVFGFSRVSVTTAAGGGRSVMVPAAYPMQGRYVSDLFGHTTSVANYWFGDSGSASRFDVRFSQLAAYPLNGSSAWALSSPIFFVPSSDCFYQITGAMDSSTELGTIQLSAGLRELSGATLFNQETSAEAWRDPHLRVGVPLEDGDIIGSRTGILRAGVTYTIGYHYRTQGGILNIGNSTGFYSLVLTPVPGPSSATVATACLLVGCRRRRR